MRRLQTPKFTLYFILIASISWNCSVKPSQSFLHSIVPIKPDYSNPAHWAALPEKKDSADVVPDISLHNAQSDALIDVFYLHPTTYTGTKGQKDWNAPINNLLLNIKTDKGAIRNQAGIFNEVGRVFAPRYRQAHLEAYFEKKNKADAKKAFMLAYTDVKAAFEYYLENYNNGRPIILASHSQGTTHSIQLIKDFFDNKPLKDQLVVAYLVGMPVARDTFNTINVCESPEEIGCFCTWRTYKEGFLPKWHTPNNNIVVTNPLNWKTTDEYVSKEQNKGAVLLDFYKGFYKNIMSARINDGLLWVEKPKFPGSVFYITSNYHVGDFNLFYLDVRENVQLRAKTYLKKK